MTIETYGVKTRRRELWEDVEGDVIEGTHLAVRKDHRGWLVECSDSGDLLARYKSQKAASAAREALREAYESYCEAAAEFREAVCRTGAIED